MEYEKKDPYNVGGTTTDQQAKIKTIRAFFGISVAAFDFARAVASSTDKAQAPSKMESLCRKALIEANKENPDLEFLDAVLFDMKKLPEAETIKPNFKSGGVMRKSAQSAESSATEEYIVPCNLVVPKA